MTKRWLPVAGHRFEVDVEVYDGDGPRCTFCHLSAVESLAKLTATLATGQAVEACTGCLDRIADEVTRRLRDQRRAA
jgi:hypothetical protein